MKLYIAGPMTGIEKHNFPAFYDAEERLARAGYDAVNPAALDAVSGLLPTWADYMERDIPYLLTCQGVALLDGWKLSRGARLEHHIASELARPVYTLRHWLRDKTIERYVK